jgi:hypothetical protein
MANLGIADSADAPERIQALSESGLEQIGITLCLTDIALPRAVQVCRVGDRYAADQFPASTRWNGSGMMHIDYSLQAVTDRADRYAPGDADIFGAMERMYVIGGIAMGIVRRKVDELGPKGIIATHAMLVRPDQVLDAISHDDDLHENERFNLRLAIMSAHEQQTLRTNVQRLAFGLIDNGGELISLDGRKLAVNAREDILTGLEERLKTFDLMIAFGFSPENALDRTNQVFGDTIPDISFALCYPMTFGEISEFMANLTTDHTDCPKIDVEQQVAITDEDLPYGFHELEDGGTM